AYQAYGDPSFVLDPTQNGERQASAQQRVSLYELQDFLESIDVDMHHKMKNYNFDDLQDELDELATHLSNPDWLTAPGTQYQLARLYGNVLPEGFVEARKACQAAIAAEDQNGHVPIVALELMANLESRQAAALAAQALELAVEDPNRQACFAEALELADNAIDRLRGLLAITKQVQIAAALDHPLHLSSNIERYALLGSAYKRLALVLLQKDKQDWTAIKTAMNSSLKAYANGAELKSNAKINAYPLINYLQLAALLNEAPTNCLQLLDQAQAAVRLKFASSNDFFDAVMSADIDIAVFLANNDKLTHSTEDLLQRYQETTQEVATTLRNFDSTVKQLRNLAQLLACTTEHLHQQNQTLTELNQQKVQILAKL
ncbi:MAG TPA: hypothetical protein PLM98_18625, partial [Thiolinea sp.]|nr:hypothetical protein [Thiolinea sp.]